MVTSREIRLKSRPVGMPSAENFELATVTVSDPALGEVQVKNIWMTVDPYMRGRMVDRASYVPPFQLGEPLQGGAIGEVVASNDPRLKRGDLVSTMFGWREFAAGNSATTACVQSTASSSVAAQASDAATVDACCVCAFSFADSPWRPLAGTPSTSGLVVLLICCSSGPSACRARASVSFATSAWSAPTKLHRFIAKDFQVYAAITVNAAPSVYSWGLYPSRMASVWSCSAPSRSPLSLRARPRL